MKRAGEVGSRPAALGALIVGALLSFGGAMPSLDGAEAAAPGAGDGPVAATLGFERAARATADRWSAARIAAAPPLDLPAQGAAAGARPASRSSEAAGSGARALVGAVLRGVRISDPESYPARAHGKLVGTYPGFGDFACSATVVSSRSGSLVTTAGHCVYDPFLGGFATNLAFAPGYHGHSTPFGVWEATHAIVAGAWARAARVTGDIAMLRVRPRAPGTLQEVVGSRGIGFGQPRTARIQAYGYPARGRPAYNGHRLIRCNSRSLRDPFREGKPRSRGIRCDMKQGASGGGWVAQRTFVVSNTSHAHPKRKGKIFGPYYGSAAKGMYRAKVRGWPSVGPIRCGGRVASIVGTDRGERIRGTNGADVIATLGGDDVVDGRRGKDRICGGSGADFLIGGGGRDWIDGGPGSDRCRAGKASEPVHRCETGAG